MFFMKTLICTISLALVFLTSCTKKTLAPTTELPVREAMGLISNDFAVLIDVREAAEIKESFAAKPALWMPMSKIESNDPSWNALLKSLPKGKKIIFHCHAGRRAKIAALKLADQGFETAYLGEFEEWKNAGLPIEHRNPEDPPPHQ